MLLPWGASGFLWESNPGYAVLQRKWQRARPRAGEVCRHSQGPAKSPCCQQLPVQVSWTTHPSWIKRNKEAEKKTGTGYVQVCSCAAVTEWRGGDECRTGQGWSACVKPKKKSSGGFKVERFVAEALVCSQVSAAPQGEEGLHCSCCSRC